MIEKQLLSGLMHSEDFARKVVPFLNQEYFQDASQRIVFNKVKDFIEKYNTPPSKDALTIELEGDDRIGENEYVSCISIVNELSYDSNTDLQWLIDKTEEFCQERAVYNAIMESINIIDGGSKDATKQSIPEILSKALSVSFDDHVGHDFLDDSDSRYEFYHHKEERIPFDLEYFNKITKGGLPRKSLNIILAGTGVGKSLAMCHMAAANLMLGKNVLYITMEMAEEKIAERIDANLLNVSLDELMNLPKGMYDKKMTELRKKTPGKLIIKEYPTASAHTGHFRHLVNELAMKRNFVPDIIYIDYLNICSSSRMKSMGGSINSYTYVKAIAEELRGLAVERNVPIISATQTTRSGYTSSDVGLEDTSESFGLPATADMMFALISTEELQELNQLMVKQLKNRYSDPTSHKRFVIGVDRAKMRLYDVEESAHDDIVKDTPADMDFKPKKFNSKDFSSIFD